MVEEVGDGLDEGFGDIDVVLYCCCWVFWFGVQQGSDDWQQYQCGYCQVGDDLVFELGQVQCVGIGQDQVDLVVQCVGGCQCGLCGLWSDFDMVGINC